MLNYNSIKDRPILDEDFVLKAFFEYFDEPQGSTGLEVGANEEYCCSILQAHGYQMTGIDTRPFSVDHRFHPAQVNGFIDWYQITAPIDKAKPYLKLPYDFIVSISAIEHFGLAFYENDNYDLAADVQTMQFIRSWIKPGGNVYITVPIGVKQRTTHWRRYDAESLLHRITSGFKIKMAKAFRLEKAHAVERPMEEAYKYNGPGCEYEILLILQP